MLKLRPSFKGLVNDLPSSLPSSFSSNTAQWICVACHNKLQWQYRRASGSVLTTRLPGRPRPLPQGQDTDVDDAPILEPLDKIVGVDDPPKIGENPAKDTRPWSERNGEYWGKGKKQIFAEASSGNFGDWRRLNHHKGKMFLAPESPFRANAAKYFPNFQGYTLEDSSNYIDTTKLLKGKVSIVCYRSQTWAEWQVDSFVGKKKNPELATALEELKDWGLQKMIITYEDDLIKKCLTYLFLWHARRKCDTENGREMRARSLIVTRGIDRAFLEKGLGISNLRVGFTFLVDHNCKIRWMGAGYANEEEKASLVRIARRLVQELKTHEESKKAAKPTPVVEKKKKKGPKPLAAMML